MSASSPPSLLSPEVGYFVCHCNSWKNHNCLPFRLPYNRWEHWILWPYVRLYELGFFSPVTKPRPVRKNQPWFFFHRWEKTSRVMAASTGWELENRLQGNLSSRAFWAPNSAKCFVFKAFHTFWWFSLDVRVGRPARLAGLRQPFCQLPEIIN